MDEAFRSVHQSIMQKIKNYASEDCIVLDVIIKRSIKYFLTEISLAKLHQDLSI